MKKKMWIIAKIKNKSIEVFKNELQKKANGKVNFYQPKISFNLKFRGKSIQKTKPILENYIFCKHENFKKKDNLNKFFFIRGLKFFLDGSKFYQKEIENFIFYCKSFELRTWIKHMVSFLLKLFLLFSKFILIIGFQ